MVKIMSQSYIFLTISYIFIVHSLSILPESLSSKKRFKRNLDRVVFFKNNMTASQKEYYEPRKRFIDRQSVKPKNDFFYQIDIIKRGTILREKNRKNLKEIKKLEKFLMQADDFQLHRYFSTNEEIYLGMKAQKAINSIKRDARLDEEWRQKNDPIFKNYLENNATFSEKKFYNKNKALFFKMETGEELIQFLKIQAQKNE